MTQRPPRRDWNRRPRVPGEPYFLPVFSPPHRVHRRISAVRSRSASTHSGDGLSAGFFDRISAENGPAARRDARRGSGTQRFGQYDRVAQICKAQFELASLFDYRRLPECLSGHPRDAGHPFPALYPAANAPQAWSSATVVSMVQAILGLQPFAPYRVLLVDPHLPEWLPALVVHHLRVGDAAVSLRFDRQPDGRSDFKLLEQRGEIRVVRAPAPWPLVFGSGAELRAKLRELMELAE